MMTPDEKCTCTHEDHTPGIGCEARWCTCFFWLVDEAEDNHVRIMLVASLIFV